MYDETKQKKKKSKEKKRIAWRKVGKNIPESALSCVTVEQEVVEKAR